MCNTPAYAFPSVLRVAGFIFWLFLFTVEKPPEGSPGGPTQDISLGEPKSIRFRKIFHAARRMTVSMGATPGTSLSDARIP